MKLSNLCLITPSNFAWSDNGLLIDCDFAENVSIYLKSFESVTVLCDALPVQDSSMLASVVEVAQTGLGEALRFVELPTPYREDKYFRAYRRSRRIIHENMARAAVVQVTPHAHLDWPTLAAQIAIDEGIPFALQADWDLWSSMRAEVSGLSNPIRRLRRGFNTRQFLHRYGKLLERCSVALLHGKDVYEANKMRTPNPRLIHNPSTSSSDRISAEALRQKLREVAAAKPLKIIYAGRTEDMKGPLEWLAVLATLQSQGIRFTAKWFGAGSMDAIMREKLARYGLDGSLSLEGKVERSALLGEVKAADIFLFCHKMRESPRNLIEALNCGTPIVGFASPYATDLVSSHGGGAFVEVGDVGRLADLVRELDEDRDILAELISDSLRSGAPLTREWAMKERIELLTTYATIERQ